METETEDEPLARRPTLASSWDAAGGTLHKRLRVSGAGLGTRDPDWDELLAPPVPGCAGPAGAGRCSAWPRSWGCGGARGRAGPGQGLAGRVPPP